MSMILEFDADILAQDQAFAAEKQDLSFAGL
jgi:hypothetical protein